MVSIVANLIAEDEDCRLRWFESRVELPMSPKRGERVWLRICNRLHLFRVVKRHEMKAGSHAVEYDFKRCRFPYSRYSCFGGRLVDALTADPKWTEFTLAERKKIFSEAISLTSAPIGA